MERDHHKTITNQIVVVVVVEHSQCNRDPDILGSDVLALLGILSTVTY